MNPTHIAFIGGGNMAAAIIGGLRQQGWPAERITVAEPRAERRRWLAERLGVRLADDNACACSEAQAVVVAVKPQVMDTVTASLKPAFQARRPLLISVAAGVPTRYFSRRLHPELAVVRCMPNTPALIGEGASVLFANAHVDDAQKTLAEQLLAATGLVRWVDDEQLMHAVTALSGSGPAYFFRLMECLQQAGERQGLPAELARELVLQTALGAARLATGSDDDPAELRRKVTSPGGTTEAALNRLNTGGLAELVDAAIEAASRRSRELQQQLEQET